LAQGHSSHGTGSAHAGHVHHLSPAPIIVGLGALLTYIGLGLGGRDLAAGDFTWGVRILALGVVAFLAGIFIWIREDIGMWRDGYVDHGVMPGHDLGWWGMVFFLGTEITLFGGLFGSFFVTRADVPLVWDAAREHLREAIPLVTLNTFILIASGVTAHTGLHMLRKGNRAMFRNLLIATILLGSTFLAIQVNEYRSLIHAGITLGGSQFGSVFYLLTGTHGFHVFLGIVFFAIILWRSLKGQFDAKRHVAMDAFTIYWHFVDVVWIGLYLVVYLGVV
jgi:cytochrome c oxidase subunit III